MWNAFISTAIYKWVLVWSTGDSSSHFFHHVPAPAHHHPLAKNKPLWKGVQSNYCLPACLHGKSFIFHKEWVETLRGRGGEWVSPTQHPHTQTSLALGFRIACTLALIWSSMVSWKTSGNENCAAQLIHNAQNRCQWPKKNEKWPRVAFKVTKITLKWRNWPKAARSSTKQPKVAKNGQKWLEVKLKPVRSSQVRFSKPDLSLISY